MEFEFQADYDGLSSQCPPKDYKEESIEKVFRWTFDDISDERNFKPQYKQNPKRFQSKADSLKCDFLSLSMFTDLDGAKERFDELLNGIGTKVYQTLGNRIAEGYILPEHGVNSPKGYLTHFNHHPSKGYDYAKIFVILVNENL